MKGVKRAHRLVVLPDFQGIGLGTVFIEEIALLYAKEGWEFNLTTTTPALIYSLNKSINWKLIRKGRIKSTFKNLGDNKSLEKTNSKNRITYSFMYQPDFEVVQTIR